MLFCYYCDIYLLRLSLLLVVVVVVVVVALLGRPCTVVTGGLIKCS